MAAFDWLFGSSDARVSALATRYTQENPIPSSYRALDLGGRYLALLGMRTSAMSAIAAVDKTGYAGGSSALESEESLRQEVKQKAESWLPVGFEQVLGEASALHASSKAWRDFVLLTYTRAEAGFALHSPAIAERFLSSGELTEDDLWADFERRYYAYQFLAMLQQKGQLEGIKIGSQLTGLGVAPQMLAAGVVVLVIVLVAVVLGVVYVINSAIHQAQMNEFLSKRMKEICFDAQGNPVDTEACRAFAANISDPANRKTGLDTFMEKLPMYVLLGGGIYLMAQIILARETGRAMRGSSR